jgi:hypothetical protein
MTEEYSITNWDKFYDNEWHYYVVTFDGKKYKHYIDGIEI